MGGGGVHGHSQGRGSTMDGSKVHDGYIDFYHLWLYITCRLPTGNVLYRSGQLSSAQLGSAQLSSAQPRLVDCRLSVVADLLLPIHP